MLYHIVWTHGGDASKLNENIKWRLSCYCADTEKILVFDRHDDLSAKDGKTMRRAGEDSTDYNLTGNSPIPNRDAILKNKHNKWERSPVMSLFNIGPNVTMDSQDDGTFTHD